MSTKNTALIKEFIQIRNKLVNEDIIDEEKLLIENVLIESLRDIIRVKVNLEQYLGKNRFKNLVENIDSVLLEIKKEIASFYSSLGLEPLVSEFLDAIYDVFEASNLLLENGLLEELQEENPEELINKKTARSDAFVFT